MTEAPAAEEPAYQHEPAEAPAEEQGFVFDEDDYYSYQPPVYNTASEEYGSYQENAFVSPTEAPLSTFSIDVDTASYSQVRQYLNSGWLPPEDTVRVEECINYFPYDYGNPTGVDPVSVAVTISGCPWNEDRALARVVVKARDLDLSEKPPSNLVFLIDVSGSMDQPNKLPLVKSALSMLAPDLRSDDRVSIVVYAGASGLVLDSCSGSESQTIRTALDRLSAGGSTAGGAGINLAYAIAEKNFIEGGNNRVILCTDGDFNVGPSSTGELERLIEKKRDSGVYLSVLGFGTGNTKDNKMETLADKGNGNYAYIDTLMEAQKVLVSEAASTLFTVAKDVKIQIEFNPKAVREYRLVGYDNRMLNPEDFNNDRKDAGEMGAGHCVTAFYEMTLIGSGAGSVDDLVFQDNAKAGAAQPVKDWMYVKLRYKQPDASESRLITTMAGQDHYTNRPDADFQFASAVAEFALLLKNSDYLGNASFDSLIRRAEDARGIDPNGYRAQFVQLAGLARQLGR
jgi:Ca-activated chloride channel family protein